MRLRSPSLSSSADPAHRPQRQSVLRLRLMMLAGSLLLALLLLPCPAQAHRCPSRCDSCLNGVAECSSRSLVAPPKSYPQGTRILNLQGNHIRVLGSRTFRRLPTLEVFKASGNKIVALRNEAFQAFPNLMMLDLQGNRISRVYPRALRNLPQLRTLSLNRNRIRSLSRVFRGTPNLFQLNMEKNWLTSIGENDLSPLTRAHNLDFRNNRITTIHARAFSQLQFLRFLFLNNNPITRLPQLEFASAVLQQVDLSHCQLEAVPRAFPASLTDLRLGHNSIVQVNHSDFINITDLHLLALNDNEISFVADGALAHLQELEEVFLRSNRLVYIPRNLPNSMRRLHIDSNLLQQIEAGVFNNRSRLEFLTLENNEITSIQPDTFSDLRFLTTLNLQGNQINTLETGAFSNLGSLNSLLLSNNPLQRIHAGAFQHLGNLTQMYMSYQLPPGEVQLDTSFLPEMLRLQILQVMNSPGLAQALVDEFDNDLTLSTHQPLRNLTQLDLSYNTLEWVTPKIRQRFPNLQSLPLDGNPLRCSQRLRWLQQWMLNTDVTFYNYEDVLCDSPSSLQGRPLRSVERGEWGENPSVQQRGGTGQLGTRVRISGGSRSSRTSAFRSDPLALRARGRSMMKRSKSEKSTDNDGKAKKRRLRGRKGSRKGKGKARKNRRKNRDGKQRKERRNKKEKRRKQKTPVEETNAVKQ